MYGYQQRGEESGAVKRIALGVAAVLALGAIGWFAVRPMLTDDAQGGTHPNAPRWERSCHR